LSVSCSRMLKYSINNGHNKGFIHSVSQSVTVWLMTFNASVTYSNVYCMWQGRWKITQKSTH
jgi:hypothetical protein